MENNINKYLELIRKIFLVFILFIFLLLNFSFVYSSNLDDAQTYYSFDADDTGGTQMKDISLNNHNGTCFMDSNCDTTTGRFKNASDFDGINDYINVANTISGNWNTISYWLKPDLAISTTASCDGAWGDGVAGNKGLLYGSCSGALTNELFILRHPTFNDFQWWSSTDLGTSNLGTGWLFMTFVWNTTSGEYDLYLNATNYGGGSSGGTPTRLSNVQLQLGNFNGGFYDGRIDEFAIYNYSLTPSQINTLFNSGNPYEITTQITFNNPENNGVYNVSSQLLNLTFSTNTKASYILNGASEVDLCSSCNFSNNRTLTLVEGLNNLTVITNTSNFISNSSITFSLDTTIPSLSVINNSESDSYYVNFSNIINASDVNLDTCLVYIDNGDVTSCFNESYLFPTNGNHTFNVSVNDTAGNINNLNNNKLLINPTQYIYFHNSVTSTPITNFYIDGVLYGDYFNFSLFDYGYGTQTLTFVKSEYNNLNFTFNLNSTSNLNVTYNVIPVTITIYVYNEFDIIEQLYFNITIINDTTSTIYLNQFNFSKNYGDTITGNLTIIIESENYLSRNFYTTLSEFTSVSQVLYLIPVSDSDQVIFRTISSLDSQPVSNSYLNFFRYINGSKVFLGQSLTDGNGYTSFNLDSTKIYEILITSDGYISQTFNSLPNTLTYTIILNPEGVLVDWLFNQFSYKFTPTITTLSSLPANFSVIYIDQDNLITNAIFTISGNGFSYSTSSTMPSGTTLTISNINNISSVYTANLTVNREGQTYTFLKFYNYYNESNYNTTIVNLADTLDGDTNVYDRILVIIVGFVIFGAIGSWLAGGVGGAIALFIPLILYAYVGWLPIGLSILLMCFIILGVLVFGR